MPGSAWTSPKIQLSANSQHLGAYAVKRAVYSVKNDTEECIEPVDDRSSLDDGDASRAAA